MTRYRPNMFLLWGLLLGALVAAYLLWPVRAKLPGHGGDVVDVTTTGGVRFVLHQHYNFDWTRPYGLTLRVQPPGQDWKTYPIHAYPLVADRDAWLAAGAAELGPHRIEFYRDGEPVFAFDAQQESWRVPFRSKHVTLRPPDITPIN